MAEISKQEVAAIRRARRIEHALRLRAHEHRFPDPNRQPTSFKEDLPFPFVLYPRASGSFFAFQEEGGVEPAFCECSRYPLRQRIELLNRQAERLGITYSLFRQVGVPDSLTLGLTDVDSTSIAAWLSALRFVPGLCHECNRVFPKLRYCVPLYGGPFSQVAGWYIQKCISEWGICFGSEPLSILGDRCPEDVRRLALENIPGAEIPYREMAQNDRREANRIHLLVQKRTRRIMRLAENEVRRRFGFPPVGSLGGGELVVLHVVRRIYPGHHVEHRIRPPFLEGLELDIFIPDLRFAVEVQGQQHFDPVEHWGGDPALGKLIERDRRKAALCKANGVKLLELAYNEPLDEGYLRVRFGDCLADFNPLKRPGPTR